MRAAVIGAGALGAVYGVRLAVRARVDVTFVVRPSRVGERAPLIIERVKGDERDVLERPERASEVPADTDVVLAAVRTENLGSLRVGSSTPIVVLTPMMPRDWRRAREVTRFAIPDGGLGDRVHAALPSVIAYVRASDRVVRYWLPPTATRIDEPRAGREAVRALAGALSSAGLRARFEPAVHDANPATTASWIPIAMGVCAAGSVRALADDRELAALTARACRQGIAIGRCIGRPDPPTQLAPLASSPWAIRAALRALSAEAIAYAEEHFARKLREQHVLMADEMSEIAVERSLPHDAIDALRGRILARA